MATAVPQDFSDRRPADRTDFLSVRGLLEWAGSLKFTCVLFALGMFIVFVGSLAQARRDVWHVVNQYFRVYIAEIEVRDFFPPSMFPELIDVPWEERLGIFASFPFPGGWLIGWLLLINLLAAHITRIRMRAEGFRLWGGLLTIAAGFMLMALIVVTGNRQTGVEHANTLLSPDQIWMVLLGIMAVSVIGFAAAAFFGRQRTRAEKRVLLGIAGSIAAVLIWFAVSGPVNLSSMRILWQLMKACLCAGLLLVGSSLLFRQRGGIVVLHTGIAILMISELIVGLYGHESLMTIVEGEQTNYARDIREVELAIISPDGDQETVVAVPQELLLQSADRVKQKQPDAAVISLAEYGVPFDIRVTQFLPNSRLRSAGPDDELTESGLGSFAVPVPLDPVDGMSDETNESAAYIEIIDRRTGQVVRKVLTSFSASEHRSVSLPERITFDSAPWDLVLRFRRNYRPYSVRLEDVRRDNYVGSNTPRNYQSTIVITDSRTHQSEEFTLWMNNPLRYRGETFYQSGYHPLPDGKEATTLQLVRNTGWMLPYIGCVVAAFGMFGHFWLTLRRFLNRSARTARRVTAGRVPAIAAVATALICAGWVAGRMRLPDPVSGTWHVDRFGQLPMAGGGRTQPIDSWARSQLLLSSHRSTFKGELTAAELDAQRGELLETIRAEWPDVDFTSLESFHGEYPEWIEQIARLTSSGDNAVEARLRDHMTTRRSALWWFLDLVARPDRGMRHRVIWIDNDQILARLNLELRPKELVYSLAEIQPGLKNLEQVDREARQLQNAGQDNRLTSLQRRTMALFNTLRRLDTMQQVFQPAGPDDLLPSLVDAWRIMKRLDGAPVPLAIATGIDDEQRAWETVRVGSLLRSCRDQMTERGITNRSDLTQWFRNRAARETVLGSLQRSFELLQEAAAERAGNADPAPGAPQELAASLLNQFDEGYEKELFSLIAAAEPDQSMEDVIAGLSPDRIRKLAGEKITRDLFDVFRTLEDDPADQRLQEVRMKLRLVQQNLSDQDDAESALSEAMNQELFTILTEDLDARAGTLLYASDDAAVFDASTAGILGALEAWGTDNLEQFNQAVAAYQTYLDEHDVPFIDRDRVDLEVLFNHFDPFWRAIYLYLTALLLSFVAWILWPRTLRQTAWAMILVAFVVHSAALWMRMEISGRPPVTSLYSSAIFIGWAMVAASLVIERLVGWGIGNLVGAATGCATLLIAHYLAREEGDTFSVMQAVLDTTFWLATHVVCITLGYGATFLAGFLGLCYVILRRFRPTAGPTEPAPQTDSDRIVFLGRVVYGVLCFALFFSLVGTVLGGLWADDSWGRFWGWDPKENGALIIVLWNALILHARWDRMVRDYGTAVLAMGGNIVTAWSWFGVNELRAGLHTYGFTEGRLAMLLSFVAVQMVIIIAAVFLRPARTAAAE